MNAAFIRDNAGNLIELMERPDYFPAMGEGDPSDAAGRVAGR
jgi:hypothetical protein